MSETKKRFEKHLRFRFSCLALATVSPLMALVLSSQLTLARQPNQHVFHSPEEASAALVAAAQHTDNRCLAASVPDPAALRRERIPRLRAK